MTSYAPFIVLEGPEGAGKTIQARLLVEWLRSQGMKAVQTREPGGTAAGDAIRSILLQSDGLGLVSETEALLMSASRAQLVREMIVPSLEQEIAVVSDRYTGSTFAYQGGGSGLPLSDLVEIQRFATGGLQPDVVLLLDLPVEIGLSRRYDDESQVNRFDRAPLEYHQRVRATFLEQASADPECWAIIDATQSVKQVSSDIRSIVQQRVLVPAGAHEATDV